MRTLRNYEREVFESALDDVKGAPAAAFTRVSCARACFFQLRAWAGYSRLVIYLPEHTRYHATQSENGVE